MMEYVFIINILTFLLYALDKFLAIRQQYRIPERVLLTLSILGGCFGSLLGMIIFHHKTRKKKFQILISLSTFLWINIIIGVYRS